MSTLVPFFHIYLKPFYPVLNATAVFFSREGGTTKPCLQFAVRLKVGIALIRVLSEVGFSCGTQYIEMYRTVKSRANRSHGEQNNWNQI